MKCKLECHSKEQFHVFGHYMASGAPNPLNPNLAYGTRYVKLEVNIEQNIFICYKSMCGPPRTCTASSTNQWDMMKTIVKLMN